MRYLDHHTKMWGYTLLIYFYLHRVTRKRSLEKKKRRKKKLNSLFPSRIPYGFANNHVIDTFSTDASAHSHIQEPTAITPHQIYSPPTSRHPALYHFLECPLPFSERERKRERVSLPIGKGGKHLWDDRGWIVDTDFGDRFSRYFRETSNGPRMSNRSGDEYSKGIFQKPAFQITCFVTEFFTTLNVRVHSGRVINTRPRGYYKSDSILRFLSLFCFPLSLSLRSLHFDTIHRWII